MHEVAATEVGLSCGSSSTSTDIFNLRKFTELLPTNLNLDSVADKDNEEQNKNKSSLPKSYGHLLELCEAINFLQTNNDLGSLKQKARKITAIICLKCVSANTLSNNKH